MTKFYKYLALLIFSFLWLLGCSKSFSDYLFDQKILKDDFRYGDLYRLSNLPKFKKPLEKCEQFSKKEKIKISLFLAGDSFTEDKRISEKDFVADSYFRGNVAEANEDLPEVTTKKVLIIETVERHFRERFAEPWKNWEYKLKKGEEKEHISIPYLLSLNMPYNEKLHQASLFGFDAILRIKEWKALLNYYLFNKIDEKVYLSNDKNSILYYLDIEPGISSCFDTLEEKEIEKLVRNVNITYEYYKSLGFDEVILSIIPNKTSILGRDLGNYNNLVARLENNSKLEMPLISVSKEFEKGGSKFYDLGDSHWNCVGEQIWINKVNDKLLDL